MTGDDTPHTALSGHTGPPMKVIAVFGPTGVGKTAVAIALATRLRERGEDPVAVSADAMQVYEGLPILTGAATAAEQAELEHRLLAFVAIDADVLGRRLRRARPPRRSTHCSRQRRRPIVVGGTGLYLRAALADLDLRPPVDPAIRRRSPSGRSRRCTRSSPQPWRPGSRRPTASASSAPTSCCKPATSRRRPRTRRRSSGRHTPATRRCSPRSSWTARALARRIDARVDAMIADGASEEVERADAAGASATARRALGFEELLNRDVEAMKTRTRRYAKRQLTWLRKLPGAHLIDVTDRSPQDVAAELLAII